MLSSVGDNSAWLVLLSALWIFAGAWYRVTSKPPPATLAASMTLLLLPARMSVCGNLSRMISSHMVIGVAQDLQNTSSDMAAGVASDLLKLFVELLSTAPSYFLLVYSQTTRTLPPATPQVHTASVCAPPLRTELPPA
ncbi:MAG: hypothetical protein SFV23_22860 [Planctomycetaceae bacterium]|nr:hypothetical protein [Planctomycetaceae bacterium]